MTSDFLSLARVVAAAEHAPDICLVVVPHPLGMIAQVDVRKKAEDAFTEILKAATEWQPSRKPSSARAPYPAERFEFAGSVEAVSELFLEKRWSLGLPIIPPTPERVEKMLKGTTRKPDEVLGQAPPLMGALTVELVAVNAVMAGCRAEYMPVLIAALEALLDPVVNWRGGLATTGTTQSVVIVNGPVVKEAGIACEQGAAGKGYHANASIGYAINLIAYNAGGSKPPSVDKSTLGSPADIVCWVFGENEDRLPPGWEPLHVERGFKRSDSVVTVLSSYPPVDNIDHWSGTPEEHIRWWSNLITPLLGVGGPCQALTMEQSPIIAMGPEHADLVASARWTKQDFKRAFWQQARLPLSAWPPGCSEMSKLRDNLGAVTPETMIPITLKPEQFLIVIAGGVGKHSHYFAPFPGSFAVSKLVKR